MDIEKIIEQTESHHQLRSEIISEIQQIVSKAKASTAKKYLCHSDS